MLTLSQLLSQLYAKLKADAEKKNQIRIGSKVRTVSGSECEVTGYTTTVTGSIEYQLKTQSGTIFYTGIGNIDIVYPELEPVGKGKKECWNHHWVKYTGFSERYEFCEQCDKKRDWRD